MARRRSSRAVAIRTRYVSRGRRSYGHSIGRGRISLAMIVGLIAGFRDLPSYYQNGGWQNLGRGIILKTTGYDNLYKNWSGSALWGTYMPIVLGMVVHGIANRFGLNRTIARYVPMVSV